MILAARRRLATLPVVRKVLKVPAVERVVATAFRSTTVHGSARFVARELFRRSSAVPYRLRGSALIAVIRHDTPDVATLDFYQRQYALPDEIAEQLPPAPEVVDLGANIGLFGLSIATRFPDARVTAVEADPANAQVLRRTRDLNGFDWEVVEAVAASQSGTAPFVTGRFSLSRVEEDAAATRFSSVDAFAFLAAADLAKIDIEGSEWELLCSPRFASEGPEALVLEFHPYLAPSEDSEGDALRLLRQAGYRTGEVLPTAPGHGVVWAWRQPSARS
jgi:FkbM family methyltransferase